MNSYIPSVLTLFLVFSTVATRWRQRRQQGGRKALSRLVKLLIFLMKKWRARKDSNL